MAVVVGCHDKGDYRVGHGRALGARPVYTRSWVALKSIRLTLIPHKVKLLLISIPPTIIVGLPTFAAGMVRTVRYQQHWVGAGSGSRDTWVVGRE